MNTTFHRHARVRLDGVVREAFAALACDRAARAAFGELLVAVRRRSTLLQPTRRGEVEREAVQVLVRLARLHRVFRTTPSTWPGGDLGLRPLVHSLAAHMLGRYRVPAVLTAVWLSDEPGAALGRRWFIEHARGRPFRKVTGLPIPMTCRMENIFLRSPPHLSLPAALRRAEVLALGGDDTLVDTILTTRLARELDHADFWRTTLRFLVRHRDALTAGMIETIVTGLLELALDRPLVLTPDGPTRLPPIAPRLSVRGRTPETLLRTIDDLRRRVVVLPAGRPRWGRSGADQIVWAEHEGRTRWHLVELLHPTALVAEGRALQHCVGSYAGLCLAGAARIWSLRCQVGDTPPERRYTIELDPRSGRIVQIGGYRNRNPDPHARRIIETWATDNGYAIDRYATV